MADQMEFNLKTSHDVPKSLTPIVVFSEEMTLNFIQTELGATQRF